MSFFDMLSQNDRQEIRENLFASKEFFDATVSACVRALGVFRDDSQGFDAIHDRAHVRHVFDKGVIFNARQEIAAVSRVIEDYLKTNIDEPTNVLFSSVERLKKISRDLSHMIDLWATK